jgi:hypothetical protein
VQVDLKEVEWQQVMAIISTAPWRDANALLMKIGEQLRLQQPNTASPSVGKTDGNGQEVRHE